MSWLEFFAGVIGSIAWPVAIVVVVLLLRHQIRNLIPLLRRIRYGEFEAEFSEEVVEAAEEIQQQAEETPVKELPALSEDEEKRLRTITEKLREHARENPQFAVLEAWRFIELEARRAARRNNIDATIERAERVGGRRTYTTTGIHRILRELADRERIPEWVVDAVGDLRDLRAVSVEHEVTPTAAASAYVNSVASILEFLARAQAVMP